MKLEAGKFYVSALPNTGGGHRKIAVLGPVETYRWGKMFVIEEADKSGHAVSCAEINQEFQDETWIEIGHDEWMLNFEHEFCDACGFAFKEGAKVVPTDDGPLHADCHKKRIEERGPKRVETIIH